MNRDSLNISKLKSFIPLFFSGETLLFWASFLSFPILTRILSKSDYGLMGLITITLMILENIFSGGMRQSILRFYEEYREKDNTASFYSSILNVSIILGLIGIILLFVMLCFCTQLSIIKKEVALLLAFSSVLILIRLGLNTQQAFLRIQEKVLVVNAVDILVRYGGIIFGIVLLFWQYGLYGFYSGLIIAESFVAALLFCKFKQNNYRVSIDKEIVKRSFKYGYPLMFSTLAVYLFGVGDRYVIAYLLTKEALANYIVAYSFSGYGIEVVKNVCIYSFQPLIMNAWNRRNVPEANSLLRNYIRVFSLLGIPMAFGLMAIRQEGVALLAGAKYSNVTFLVPVLVLGILFNGVDFVSNAGFLYRKKTGMLMLLTLGVAVINISLNFVLLPIMGVIGAALATLFSYCLYAVIGTTYSYKVLRFKIPWLNIGKYILFSMIMFLLVTHLPVDSSSCILNVMTKIAIGILIYTSFILFFERSLIMRLKKSG